MLKSRATIEDILNLPPEGWEAIAKMNDEQLAEYLKDICDIEPPIVKESQLRGGISSETEDADDNDDGNPIKSKKKSKPKSKLTIKEKTEESARNIKSLFNELGINL